jgi:hypothetical protein
MAVVWASKYVAAPFILAGIVLTVGTRSGSAVSAVELPHLQPTENIRIRADVQGRRPGIGTRA